MSPRRQKLDALRGAVLSIEDALADLAEVERAATGRSDLGVGGACAAIARARRLIDGARSAIAKITGERRDLTHDEIRRARGVLEAAEMLMAVREAVGPVDAICPISDPGEARVLN